MDNSIQKQDRQSGIELLKVFAIFFIIVSHVSYDYDILFENSDFFTNVIIRLLKTLGTIGNYIFIISTSWFLYNDNKISFRKIFKIIIDITIISILFVLIYLFFTSEQISFSLIKESVFTIIYGTNWYVTAYLLIYIIHPILNTIIENCEKNILILITSNLSFIYLIICRIFDGEGLFYSNLIVFILIYMIINILRKYFINKINKKQLVFITIISFLLIVCEICLTYLLGLKIGFFMNLFRRINEINNVLIFTMCFSLFLLIKDLNYKNKTINYISSLSIYMYVMHDNIIFRGITRYKLLEYLTVRLNFSVLFDVLISSLMLFLCFVIISIIYKNTLGKVSSLISSRLEKNKYGKIINN